MLHGLAVQHLSRSSPQMIEEGTPCPPQSFGDVSETILERGVQTRRESLQPRLVLGDKDRHVQL